MNMKHGTHREEDHEDANDDHQDMIVKDFRVSDKFNFMGSKNKLF